MLRRIIAITVIVIGVAALVGAIGSATFWRPDERVTATMPAAPTEPVVVTAPGVLDMVDATVDVRVVAGDEDTPVLLAMGREADVHAWIGDAAHAEITGLSSWDTLTVRHVPATPADEEPDDEEAATEDEQPEEGGDDGAEDEAATEDEDAAEDQAEQDLPDPAGSDLWIEEVTGTGELTYQWTAVPGRWVMLVASDGTGPAPQVELTWDRQVDTPLLIPGVIVGGVLVLAGAVALVLFLLMDREAARARRAREESERAAAALPARREARHREDAAASELTYAQRLGWPGADSEQPTDPEQTPLTEVPADTGELPTSVLAADGTPLTRRELRERERAEAEAARARSRKWWHIRRREEDAGTATPEAPTDDAGAGTDSSGLDTAADEPGGTVPRWFATTDAEQHTDRDDEEQDPHTSGARWRQTWGIQQQSRTDEENR